MTDVSNPQTNRPPKAKYVFVGGMPRSGTSMLARNIARFEDCTGFKNTGVVEDEGQFLQDVYPITPKLGGAGNFGFDPRAHRTETSPLLTRENIARLSESWHAHWDSSKSICIEKTPGNLLMTRFLQAAFPASYFIIVKRHPVPVAMAAQKWKVAVVSLNTALAHWLHCYDLYEQDKKHLHRVYELRYEDYVKDRDRYHREIAAFIGTRVLDKPESDTVRYVTQWGSPNGVRRVEASMEATSDAYNQKYLARWSRLVEGSIARVYYRHLARKYEPRVAMHGYSLVRETSLAGESTSRGKLSEALGEWSCYGADACAMYWRAVTLAKFHARRRIRPLLPDWVRRVMGRPTTASQVSTNTSPTSSAAVRQLDRYSQ